MELIVLIYNKLHDPYHTFLRLLKIITTFENGKTIEYDRLRIYDFCLANPEEISKIRIVKAGKSQFNNYINPYNNYDRNILFYNLERIQKVAIETLQRLKILVRVNSEERFYIYTDAIDSELTKCLNDTVSIDNRALDFILNSFNDLDLYRENGLKHRTGLLGYRYDPRD
mgnify:CR=1 FL=1